jgi:hypothetical protein
MAQALLVRWPIPDSTGPLHVLLLAALEMTHRDSGDRGLELDCDPRSPFVHQGTYQGHVGLVHQSTTVMRSLMT